MNTGILMFRKSKGVNDRAFSEMQQSSVVPLGSARLCPECELIHGVEECPRCGTSNSFRLNTIIPTMRNLKPEKPTKKKGGDKK